MTQLEEAIAGFIDYTGKNVLVTGGSSGVGAATDFRATMGEKIIDWTVSQSTGALCTPRQVASVITFLGSDAATIVNGENLYADYGFSSAMTTGQVDFAGLA